MAQKLHEVTLNRQGCSKRMLFHRSMTSKYFNLPEFRNDTKVPGRGQNLQIKATVSQGQGQKA